MEIFSASLINCAGNSPVTGKFPAQRPVTRIFDVFIDQRPNKRLSKHSWGWWFETPSRPLWPHCNEKVGHFISKSWLWLRMNLNFFNMLKPECSRIARSVADLLASWVVRTRYQICRTNKFFSSTMRDLNYTFTMSSLRNERNVKSYFDISWNKLSTARVNSSSLSAAYMRQWLGSALVQIMACRLFGAKPLPKPMLGFCQLDPYDQNSVKFQSKHKTFHSRKCIWKYLL